jgi:hypothetical protein
MTAHPWQGAYCDPATNKCYNLRGVEAGGNYTLNVIDLTTLQVSTYDLGLAVETTDGHFNPGMCGLTSDRNKLVCCRARWSGLRCMEIDLQARTARWLGEIAPAGDTSLNYPKWFRIRPDKWLMMARTGDAQWSFFEFRGEPEQILDSALWSKRAILPNNSGTGGSCADGSIYFMYQAILFQDPYEPHRVWMGYHNRCIPPPNRFTFGLMYYDIVRDRFYGWKGDLLDETRTYRTFDPELKVEYQPPPGFTDAVRAEVDGAVQGVRVRTTAYDYILSGIKVMTAVGAGWDRAGIVKIDLTNKTATASYLDKVTTDVDTASVQPFIATTDGKAVGVQGEEAGTIVLYDPATDSLTEITGGRGVGSGARLWVLGDKTLIPATHIFMSRSIIAVWENWNIDMKMLTKCLAVGGAGNVRVEADFWAVAPSRLEVIIYRLPDLTVEATDTITSPSKPFTKTYTVSAGNKRVLCRAIP